MNSLNLRLADCIAFSAILKDGQKEKSWIFSGIFIFCLGVSAVNCHSLIIEMKPAIEFTFTYCGLITFSKYISLC